MANILDGNLFGLTSSSNAQSVGATKVPTAAQRELAEAAAVFTKEKSPTALDTAFYSKAQLDELKISPIAKALSESEAASEIFVNLAPGARKHLADLVSSRLMKVDEVVSALRGMAKEALITSDTILLKTDDAEDFLGVDEEGRLKIPDEKLLKKDPDQYWKLRTEGLKTLNNLDLFANEADSDLTSAKDIASLEKLSKYLAHPPDMNRQFRQAQEAYLADRTELGDIPPRGHMTIKFEATYTSAVDEHNIDINARVPANLGRVSTFLSQLDEISRRNAQALAKRTMAGPVIIKDD